MLRVIGIMPYIGDLWWHGWSNDGNFVSRGFGSRESGDFGSVIGCYWKQVGGSEIEEVEEGYYIFYMRKVGEE